jgi:hypothetical protein
MRVHRIICLLLCLSLLAPLAIHTEAASSSQIQSEIQQLENNLNNSISMLRSDQSAAITHMQDLMEKEASILTHTDFSLNKMNLENKTFVLSGNVTPKEHQPGVTEAFLTVNGTAYPMQLANGIYTIQVDLPLFEEDPSDQHRKQPKK